MNAAAAVGLALLLDLTLSEFPSRLHPVVWFGRAAGAVDRESDHPLVVGTAAAVGLPLLAAVVAGGLVALASTVSSLLAVALAGVVLFSTTSLRMLLDEVRAVVAATESDVEDARERLRSLAGRDSSDLSAGQLRSAAVESAAENLADGLVAPLLAFAVGSVVSLPVAAAAAAWVKGVNTLDSMLGYRSKRVGTPSARLDDAVMWLPARASALLLAVAAGAPRALAAARKHADAPPSPNSGWPMATLAAALGVRLEKPDVYTLPYGPDYPTVNEGRHAVRVVGTAGVLATLLTALLVSGVVSWP